MRNFDKLIAGVLLTAMTLFWVIMSPAAITSRTSEAIPASINQPGLLQPTLEDRELAERQKEFRESQQITAAQIKRLKKRSKDTPPEAREQMKRAMSEPAVRNEGDASQLRNLDEVQGLPTLH